MADRTPRGLWITAPHTAELRPALLGEGEVEVATRFTGISRGTEALVFGGRVPASEHMRMRAPLQEGAFPAPVKYGYAAVGEVVAGPRDLLGRDVFSLHPHQDRFCVPAGMAFPLPADVPAGRAVLGANMETALNVIWDAGAAPGDRLAVIGAGVVGALVGWLAGKLPGVEATLVDLDPARERLARALGCRFAAPGAAPQDCDIVVHASASASGLATALAAAGQDATVVEASWFGEGTVPVPLGGAFHSRRLRIVASQVGAVPPARRARWSNARRLAAALELLADPALDALISGETRFDAIAGAYGEILASPSTLCHRIRYR